MADSDEIRKWKNERKKNEESRAWKEILAENIRRIDPDIDSEDAANMLAIQLRDSSTGLMDVIASDASLKNHATQMSINSTGYGTKTQSFLSALEATRTQYKISAELEKNLKEESFSGDGDWQKTAREFVRFVAMSSGQPVENFFNPASDAFSADKKNDYTRIFRFQNDIRGIGLFEFNYAVRITDAREIVAVAQPAEAKPERGAEWKAFPESEALGILAEKFKETFPIHPVAAGILAEKFAAYAKRNGKIETFGALLLESKDTVEKLVSGFLSDTSGYSYIMKDQLMNAVRRTCQEIAEKAAAQPDDEITIFTKHLSGKIGVSLSGAGMEANAFARHAKEKFGIGSFVEILGKKRGDVLAMVSSYLKADGYRSSYMESLWMDAMHDARREIDGQAKTPARVDAPKEIAGSIGKNAEFMKNMEAAGLGAEAQKILAYLERKNTTLEKISEIELWRQSVSLFDKPRTSYDSWTGIGIANKIIEAAGKHAAAASAKEMKLTDWETAFACYMHDNYRKRVTALEAIAYFKKNGISEEKIISLGENEIIGLISSMPCGYGSSRMYTDIDSARKQLLRGIEYANKEERGRLKLDPIEYPCIEHKTTIRFEDIGSERHYRRRAGPDATGTETSSQQSSPAGNAYFGGLPSGTTDVLALVRQRDAAIERRKAWEKSHPGANKNNGKRHRH